jgi:acyl-CoA hydrolase
MIYRYLVTQPDLNAHGTLHGGILMKWVDEACGMEARLQTNNVCATVHINDITFFSTARLGDIVEITVSGGVIGRTSITFSATAQNAASKKMIATFKNVVFVAIDENNSPVPIK